MPAAAIIGAGIIGAGSSIIAGNKADKALQQTSNAQIAESRRQYDQSRADMAPWMSVGGSAIQKLGGLYGLNGGTPSDQPYGGFFESPDYQFRLDEGKKALERSASATGMLGSGAALKAANNYVQNTASSEYGNWYNRLAGLAGQGQTAANTTVAAGQNNSNNIIGALGQSGNARASSYANTGAAINNGMNNILSAYLFNKGGGFGGSAGNVGQGVWRGSGG